MTGCAHYEPPCDCGRARCPECGGLPAADEVMPNIPEGWGVLWCPTCGYSVTVAELSGAYDGDTLLEAAAHEH